MTRVAQPDRQYDREPFTPIRFTDCPVCAKSVQTRDLDDHLDSPDCAEHVLADAECVGCGRQLVVGEMCRRCNEDI